MFIGRIPTMASGDRWRREQDRYRDDERDRWRNERESRDYARGGRSGDYRGGYGREGRDFGGGEYGEGGRFGGYRGSEDYGRGYGGE
jgi:hypothetical protein